jgi:Tat protein secretion system quality control protein TatD with DNase activity
VPWVAREIAQLRGLDEETVAHATTQNFFKLFSKTAQ